MRHLCSQALEFHWGSFSRRGWPKSLPLFFFFFHFKWVRYKSRKCGGNDDRLSSCKITVVGIIIITLWNYTRQKYHFWWSLQDISVGGHSRFLINIWSRKVSVKIKIMRMIMVIIIILQLPLIISLLCGGHFVCIISFNFFSRRYKSGNCGLARLNNSTDVT